MKKLLFRASQLNNILGGQDGLTEKQEITLNELIAKEKRTDIQTKTMNELIAKRDAPISLSAGAKTEVRNLVKEIYLDYKRDIKSKYLDKGNQCEDEAIRLAGLYFGEIWDKNDVHFKNEYIMGTPDVIDTDLILDTKCSWSKDTFPLTSDEAHNPDYEAQVRAYMWLLDKPKARVCYVGITTPEDLCKWENKDAHSFDDLSLEKRITYIDYDRDLKWEENTKKKIEAARVYAEEYLNQVINSKRK